MQFYIIADTHFKHENMKTYCDRPPDFTERIIKNWNNTVKPEDTVIHLGDVAIGALDGWKWILSALTGRKILVRGNNDRNRSISWWCDNGFDFACDGMRFRNCWLTHEPDTSRAGGCDLNIHGHLHNIWHGFHQHHDDMVPGFGPPGDDGRVQKKLKNPWQRLFAVEYTNYMPVEFDKFVAHPDKYQARGPHESKS